MQEAGNSTAPTVETSSDLMRKMKGTSEEKRASAKVQARKTAEAMMEFEVEAITGEKGSITAGTKQYKVKFKDYSEEWWVNATEIDKHCKPFQEYKAKKKASTIAAVSTVTADLLSTAADKLICEICKAAGITEGEIMFVYAGIPCETYSIAGKSNKGRDLERTKHGYNYRQGKAA